MSLTESEIDNVNNDIEKIKEENLGLALYSFDNFIISLYKREYAQMRPDITAEQIELYVSEVTLKRENDVYLNTEIESHWQIYLAGYITALINNQYNLNEEFKNDLAN